MAGEVESGGGKDAPKEQFTTREGTYKLMSYAEYSRPPRATGSGYTSPQGSAGTQVRVSLVTLPEAPGNGDCDRICFNYGKELYVYVYKGLKKAPDLTKPLDKKFYKGTTPTCHDFNSVTMTPDSVSLLVGFSTGQIQLIDPYKKDMSKLFNEDRLIDKTKVTCIHWVPGSTNLFLVSHASGQLYVYNEELVCGNTPPNYQPFKQGDGYTIHTCKTKSTRNPLYRWVIGTDGACINEFAFSPCGTNLAVASQDGFLRVFHYDTMELIGIARSYFGGFLCVCWSPDGRYIVVGGEDDLVTIWSFHERRVVARGQGHRSWVSVVAFDPYLTSFGEPDCHDFSGSDDEQPAMNGRNCINDKLFRGCADHKKRNSSGSDYNNRLSASAATCYRLGSVSQDTHICLWDITEDVLRQPVCSKNRTSVMGSGHFTDSGTFVGGGGGGGNGVKSEANKSPPNLTVSMSKESVSVNATSNVVNKPSLKTSNKVGQKSDNSTNNKISMNHTAAADKKLSNSKSNNVNISLSNSVSPTTIKENSVNSIVTDNNVHQHNPSVSVGGGTVNAVNSFTQRFTGGFSFGDKKSENSSHKRNFSLGSKSGNNTASGDNKTNTVTLRTKNNDRRSGASSDKSEDRGGGSSTADRGACDPLRLIGTAACPRFDECPVLEPMMCKRIAHERLTALYFREDSFVVACQDGIIYTWARPGRADVVEPDYREVLQCDCYASGMCEPTGCDSTNSTF